jgi:hypothetical protein
MPLRSFPPLSFCLLLTAMLSLCFVSSAWSLTQTEFVTISGSMGCGGSLNTSDFPAFNPQLGTLTKISVYLFTSIDYTGQGLPIDEGAELVLEDQSFPSYYANLAFVYLPVTNVIVGEIFNAPNITDPKVLSDYTVTGSRHFVVYDASCNGSDHFVLSGGGYVQYDYVAIPPPPPPPVCYLCIVRLIAGPVTPPPGGPVEFQVGFVDINGKALMQPVTLRVVPGQLSSVDLNSSALHLSPGEHADVFPVITTATGEPPPAVQITTEVFDSQTGFGVALTSSGLPAPPPSLAPQGLAGGQAMRLIATAHPPIPCIATLSFADGKGAPIGPSLSVDLKPGESKVLDLDSTALNLPVGQRIEVQPRVTLQGPVNASPGEEGTRHERAVGPACAAVADVFDKTTGRTSTYQNAQIQQVAATPNREKNKERKTDRKAQAPEAGAKR